MDARTDSFPVAGKVAVVGVGAIGGTAAYALADAGHDVTLCVRSPFDALILESKGKELRSPARVATNPASVGHVDWLFIATKTQDTVKTKPWLDALVGPETKVVLLQNGIDSVETATPLIHGAKAIPAIVYISAEKVSGGRIRHHFGNKVEVPECAEAEQLKVLCGENPWFTITPRADFINAIWKKYLCNLALNPVTALTLQRFWVMTMPSIRPLTRKLILEAAAVGRHMGMSLTDAELDGIIDYCATLDPAGGTSMMYDRMAGKPLEFEHLTGTVVRLAHKFGVDVPVNETLLALIEAIDGAAGRASDGARLQGDGRGVLDLKQGDRGLNVLNAG